MLLEIDACRLRALWNSSRRRALDLHVIENRSPLSFTVQRPKRVFLPEAS